MPGKHVKRDETLGENAWVYQPLAPNERAELWGRDEEMEQIWQWLNEGKSIFLWGIPGVGKTSLVNVAVEEWRQRWSWKREVIHLRIMRDGRLQWLDRQRVKWQDERRPVISDDVGEMVIIVDDFQNIAFLSAHEQKDIVDAIREMHKNLRDKVRKVMFVVISTCPVWACAESGYVILSARLPYIFNVPEDKWEYEQLGPLDLSNVPGNVAKRFSAFLGTMNYNAEGTIKELPVVLRVVMEQPSAFISSSDKRKDILDSIYRNGIPLFHQIIGVYPNSVDVALNGDIDRQIVSEQDLSIIQQKWYMDRFRTAGMIGEALNKTQVKFLEMHIYDTIIAIHILLNAVGVYWARSLLSYIVDPILVPMMTFIPLRGIMTVSHDKYQVRLWLMTIFLSITGIIGVYDISPIIQDYVEWYLVVFPSIFAYLFIMPIIAHRKRNVTVWQVIIPNWVRFLVVIVSTYLTYICQSFGIAKTVTAAYFAIPYVFITVLWLVLYWIYRKTIVEIHGTPVHGRIRIMDVRCLRLTSAALIVVSSILVTISLVIKNIIVIPEYIMCLAAAVGMALYAEAIEYLDRNRLVRFE